MHQLISAFGHHLSHPTCNAAVQTPQWAGSLCGSPCEAESKAHSPGRQRLNYHRAKTAKGQEGALSSKAE